MKLILLRTSRFDGFLRGAEASKDGHALNQRIGAGMPPACSTSTPTFVAGCCAITTMPCPAATGACEAA
jgi:hypothetical protein